MSDAGLTGGTSAAPQDSPNAAGASGNTANGGHGDAGQTGAPDATQKAINAVVARERARAEAEQAKLMARIEQLEASQKPAKPSEDDAAYREKIEAARKPVLDQLEAERQKRTAIETRILDAEIKAAARESVDPDLVAQLLKPHLRLAESGEIEVVDQDGKPEYGAGGPKSLAEKVAEILAARPYLAASKMRSGAGFEGSRPQVAGDLKAQIAQLEKHGIGSPEWHQAQTLKAQMLAGLMGRPAA